MPPGSLPLSLKSGQWEGMVDESLADPGRLSFRLLENCYISSDGQEIRRMPGLRLALRPNYQRTYVDSELTYTRELPSPVSIALRASTKLYHPHFFSQVNGRLMIFGENRFRRVMHRYDDATLRPIKVRSITFAAGSGSNGTITIEVPGPTASIPNYLPAIGEEIELWVDVIDQTQSALTAELAIKALIEGREDQKKLIVADAPFTCDDTTTTFEFVDTKVFNNTAYDFTAFDKIEVYCFSRTARDAELDEPSPTFFPPEVEGSLPFAWITLDRPSVTSPLHTALHGFCSVGGFRDFTEEYTQRKAAPSPNPTWLVTAGLNVFPVGLLAHDGPTIYSAIDPRTPARPRRRTRPLPYRTIPDIQSDRVVIGAPGFGCPLQVPFIIAPRDTEEQEGVDVPMVPFYYAPRSAGLPKPQIFEAADTSTPPVFSGAWLAKQDTPDPDETYTIEEGEYRFKVALRDDATGDISLPSEEVKVQVSPAVNGYVFTLAIVYPSYQIPEAHATTALIYATSTDGKVFGLVASKRLPRHGTKMFFRTIAEAPNAPFEPYQLFDTVSSPIYSAVLHVDGFSGDSSEIDFTQPPPSIEQMPMGCKAVRTVRGFTLYGGALGDAGKHGEIQRIRISAALWSARSTTSENLRPDEIYVRHMDRDTAELIPVAGVPLLAIPSRVIGFWPAGYIPPAYSGQNILFTKFIERTSVVNITEEDEYFVPRMFRIEKLMTSRDDTTHSHPYAQNAYWWTFFGPLGGASLAISSQQHGYGYSRYRIKGARQPTYANVSVLDATRDQEAWLLLPRGQLWHGEIGKPTTVPAINRLYLDTDKSEDVEAIGAARNGFLSCTRTSTYSIEFGQSLAGSVPRLLSTEFGCIAPNTMVEFDGGTAWISDRGPVALMGGEVVWIGEKVRNRFIGQNARYKRDRAGMMRHAFAVHDRDRNLVLFFLYTDITKPFRFTSEVSGVEPSLGGGTTWDLATDEQRSRFPCDEILVWSYKADAWSVWRHRIWMSWSGLTECDDGIERLGILRHHRYLTADVGGHERYGPEHGSIYVLEDMAADSNFEPSLHTPAVAATSATATFEFPALLYPNRGADPANIANGYYVDDDMRYALYDPQRRRLHQRGALTFRKNAMSDDGYRYAELDQTGIWSQLDRLLVGLIPMKLETNYLDLSRATGADKNLTPFGVDAASVRYTVNSRGMLSTTQGETPSGIGDDSTIPVEKRAIFAACSLKSDVPVEGGAGESEMVGTYISDTNGRVDGWEMLPDVPTVAVQTHRFRAGRVAGKGVQLCLEVDSALQFRIENMTLELAASAQ